MKQRLSLRKGAMDTNFELPSQPAPIPAQPSAAEPKGEVSEAPKHEKIEGVFQEEALGAEDYEAEGEAIMEIPGSSHQKLEVLAGGGIEEVLKKPKKEAKDKNVEAPVADNLEEKVLKLQQLVLTMMLKQMQVEEKSKIPNTKDLVEKIKKLIEEADKSKDKNPEVMSSVMNMLFIAFTIAGNSADAFGKNPSNNSSKN